MEAEWGGHVEHTFAVVGPGRVGRSMIDLLCQQGYTLVGVLGRNGDHSRRLAQPLERFNPNGLAIDWLDISALANLILITTPDRILESVASDLAAALGTHRAAGEPHEKIALHMSGALPGYVLSPLQRYGFKVGALHPLQAVTGDDPKLLRNIAWGIDGDPEALARAKQIVAKLEGTCLPIPTEAKPLYHAAACFVSNYLMVLLDLGAELLEGVGIAKNTAVEALVPLMDGALSNAANQGLPEALTGPIERGDTTTVTHHLEHMRCPKVRSGVHDLYRLLGEEALRMATRKGSIGTEQVRALQSILGSTSQCHIQPPRSTRNQSETTSTGSEQPSQHPRKCE